jgi:hypothetical protein
LEDALGGVDAWTLPDDKSKQAFSICLKEWMGIPYVRYREINRLMSCSIDRYEMLGGFLSEQRKKYVAAKEKGDTDRMKVHKSSILNLREEITDIDRDWMLRGIDCESLAMLFEVMGRRGFKTRLCRKLCLLMLIYVFMVSLVIILINVC